MSLFWAKFVSWCKKQWKLILGFFLGLVAVFSVLRRGLDKKTLEKKNEMSDDILAAEKDAREKIEAGQDKNLQEFLDRNEKIEQDTKQKLMTLEGEKKDRVRELLNSENPEEAIAKALSDLLD